MAADGSLTERGAHGESIAVRDQAVLRGILWGAAALTLSLLVATICAMTARFFWLGDLAVHFRVQYATLGLVTFVLFLLARHPVWAALALAVCAFNAIRAAPALLMQPSPPPAADAAADPIPLRVLAMNVFYRNDEYQRVADIIRHERPDVVALEEMNDAWRRALATTAQGYRYRYHSAGPTGRGITLWSRYPMQGSGVLPIESKLEPAIQGTLQVKGHALSVFAVHASWPIRPASAARRNRQLAHIAELARAKSTPLLIVGDLNISPFSPIFRQLLAAGNLRSAAHGFGWQPTWPTFLPLAGIQIDHGLVSAAVAVKGFRRGPGGGSDHWPIVMDLEL